jgi:enoyl-CoA hydratase
MRLPVAETSKGEPGVLVDQPHDGILRVTLNRPHRMNALDDAAVEALHGALDQAARDSDCRVVQLRSSTVAFCAGFDMSGYDGDPESRGGAAAVVEQMDRLGDLPVRMRSARQVVIATVRGPAIGGGFALVLGADIILAGESAIFQVPQTQLGVLAAEMGLSYLLPRIVGLNRAAHLMLRGGRLDAPGAERGGLVSEVWPDDEVDEAGMELARELSQRSVTALSGTKRMLLAGLDSAHLEATVRAETQSQVLSNYWPELKSSIARFKAKSPPRP